MYKGWEQEKKDKTLPERLKNFFGFSKSGVPNQQLQWKQRPVEFPLSTDILKELGPENSLAVRIKAMKDLYETVLNKHLEDKTLEALVVNTEDLVNPQQHLEARHTVLCFYKCLIQGQFEKLANIRAYFFRLIKNHNVLEDLTVRLEMFKALTDSGKVIVYFEEETGPFLLEWMPSVITSGKTHDFLVILVNFIKYNAAYLDTDVIAGLIQHSCVLSGRTKNGDDIDLCLDLMDALICYSSLPSQVLPHFIISLCRSVNMEKYSNKSWKVMRHYLGTSMGQSGIFTICWLIQDRSHITDYAFLRGAVFFLRLSLWGDNKVPTLSSLLTAVLPSLLQCLDAVDSYVAFEVVSCAQDLITSTDRSRLQHITWEILLRIIDKLLSNPQVLCAAQTPLGEKVHETLTVIERLYKEKLFVGYPDQLFDVVDRYANRRPECSVMGLIDYRSKFIYPKHEDWIHKLNHLLERYFKLETRSSIRVKVLSVLAQVVCDYKHLYQKEFIDETVLKFLSHIDIDPDLEARRIAVTFLIELAKDCHTGRCLDLIDIIGKVLCRQFVSGHLNRDAKEMSEEQVSDIRIAAQGLVKIFKCRLNVGPPAHGIHAFGLLVSYLHSFYYQSGASIEETPTIRETIFQFIMSLRANELGQLWCSDPNDTPKLSTNVFCTNNPMELSKSFYSGTQSPPLTSPNSSQTCHLNFKPALEVISSCLKDEKNWSVLSMVLQELPKLLSNKAIVICGGNSVSSLCTTLCNMLNNNALLDRLDPLSLRPTKQDVQMLLYPILAKLAAYHCEIGSHVQRILINSLLEGLVSKCVCSCVVALTLCTLQMQDVMYKMLPKVLLKLSKISATLAIAVPVLELLSNLIRHPRLYNSFVEDQYMSIFAIALPYTNPSKFHQYTVALAHHVIAMWFIKCRQAFRKGFACYIMKGLRANLVAPYEENIAPQNHSNSDSGVAHRQRSGSLHDAQHKRLEWAQRSNSLLPSSFHNSSSSAGGNATGLSTATSGSSATVTIDRQTKSNCNKTLKTLHQELLETSLDLFSRYCFMTLPNIPIRDDLSEFLMDKGISESWLVGSSLVTITTSSPGINAYRDGLCKECYLLCHPEHVPEPVTERKRHKSEIYPSRRELSNQTLLTKDDLLLNHPPQNDSNGLGGSSKNLKAERICNCWCPGWAEILIRRPTGNYSSLMRIQQSTIDFPVPDFSTWFNSDESSEANINCQKDEEPNFENGNISDSKSPLRRTSSSPDMQQAPPDTPILSNPPNASSMSPLNRSIQSLPTSPPNSPLPTNVQYTYDNAKSQSSPSSPVARQSSMKLISVEEMSNPEPPELIRDSAIRNSLRGSPRKEDKCKTILEEKHHQHRTTGRVKLTLDLSGIHQPGDELSCDQIPPHSAPVTGKPAKNTRRVGSNSPPANSSTKPFRDRTHTISVVSPITSPPPFHRSHKQSPVRSASFASVGDTGHTPYREGPFRGNPALHPSFVFLQLFPTYFNDGMEPLLLPKKDVVERAVKILDTMPPYETHAIGVVYVGAGQVSNEAAILSNRYGSVRYQDFLCKLGNFFALGSVDRRLTFLGGLDSKGQDGRYACSWQDDIMQVIFHVATLMPNRPETDPAANDKKRHIGNDFVTIVYNNSGVDFDKKTLKGQFNYVCIIIEPSDCGTSIVSIKAKPELTEFFSHLGGPSLISDEFLSVYVRQLALHADLASLVKHRQYLASADPYINNWLERLRQLKRLKEKVMAELNRDDDPESSDSPRQYKDFTCYV